MSVETVTPAPEPATGRSRSRRVWLVVLAVVLVVMTVVGVRAWTWWRNPDVFSGSGASFRSGDHTGKPLFVGLTYENDEVSGTVTIRDLEPRIRVDSSAPRFDFFVCVGQNFISSEDLERECVEVRPVSEGDSLRVGVVPQEVLVMRIQPTGPGVVKVNGVDFTYTYGWQTGTQRVGDDVTIKTKTID